MKEELTEEEKFYNEFIQRISTDILEEARRDGAYWTVDKAINGRLEIIKEDIKNYINE